MSNTIPSGRLPLVFPSFYPMISSIGFLENTGLKHFNQFKQLHDFDTSPYAVPGVDVSKATKSKNLCEDEIEPNERVLFGTVNSDDISSLAVFSSMGTESYIHHDLIIMNTIINGKVVSIGQSQYVCLSAFDHNLLLYDPYVELAPYPNGLLSGHDDEVSYVAGYGENLYSAAGREIINWDLNVLKPRNTLDSGIPIEIMQVSDGMLYCVHGDSLLAYDTRMNTNEYAGYNSSFAIESFDVRDGLVWCGDAVGNLEIFDTRNDKNKQRKSVSTSGIASLKVVDGNRVVVCSDRSVKVVDDLSVTKEFNLKSSGLCIEVDGLVYVGTESDEIEIFEIEEKKETIDH